MNPQELLKAEQFVKEPVDNYFNTLIKDSSKRIILNSGRGTGKSTILYNAEIKSVETEDPIIYTQFDSVVNFSVMPNRVFNETFFEHYYELDFSWELLKFIKRNYFIIYENYFKDIEVLLKSMTEELDRNIRGSRYNGISLTRQLLSMEITSEILRRLKNYLSLSSINLMIDRFDWTNGRSSFSQHILEKYFDAFDKTIITSDDEKLDDANNRKKLEEKGYSFITTNYGNDVEIIKCIIKKRIQLYSKNADIRFDADTITDEIYTNLINKTRGNISLMLASVKEVINSPRWYDENPNIASMFNYAIEKELTIAEQVKKMRKTSPRLYL